MNQPGIALEWHQETDANDFSHITWLIFSYNVCVVNVASYDNYMLINSYLTFCFLLFSMTTLLQLGVSNQVWTTDLRGIQKNIQVIYGDVEVNEITQNIRDTQKRKQSQDSSQSFSVETKEEMNYLVRG